MKRMLIMIRAGLFILFCTLGLISFGQDVDEHDGNRLYDHNLDENKWEKIRNDIRYEGSEGGPGRRWTYESNREYNDARRKSGNGNGNGNGGGGSGTGGAGSGSTEAPDDPSTSSSPPPRSTSRPPTGLGFLGYIFLAVFIVALIVLIYFLFINAPKKGKQVGTPIILEDVNPTEIPLTELQKMLQEALAKKDYRGAVRIYFIFIVRDLAEKKWIHWEKEKTNFHYLREMAGKPEYDDFNRSVSYFEIIWYGQREIDESKFQQIKPNFTKFLDRLGVK